LGEAVTKKISSLGVDWFLPGKKRRFATSTKATSDLIELIADDGYTVSNGILAINYDEEARDILRAFETAGYGGHKLMDVLRNNI
jgi:hypothetical protein